jgi:hypothetical protein
MKKAGASKQRRASFVTPPRFAAFLCGKLRYFGMAQLLAPAAGR